MKRFFGVFSFALNVLGMAKSNTTLLKPILVNLAIAMPLSLMLCFYLWAKECEAQGSSDVRLAPKPLADAFA
ncbi:MAG: hypothetical protein AB1730_26220 [Myxococcota bacterium]|jgi:hypothetical protein